MVYAYAKEGLFNSLALYSNIYSNSLSFLLILYTLLSRTLLVLLILMTFFSLLLGIVFLQKGPLKLELFRQVKANLHVYTLLSQCFIT